MSKKRDKRAERRGESASSPPDRPAPAPAWRRLAETVLFWLLAACGAWLNVHWATDVGFMNDEPLLLRNALDANLAGHLAARGLHGTVGVQYGPVPTWLYQLGLLVTHDPVALVRAKALLCGVAVFAAALALCRGLGVSRWPALTVWVSPYVWLYDRALWDNCYQIPFGVLMVAAWLRFRARPSGGRLLIVLLAGAALFHTHLMNGPTLAGVAAALLWFDGRWLRRAWRQSLPPILLTAALCTPYGWYVIRAFNGGTSDRIPAADALGYGLSSGRFFTWYGFRDYFLPGLPLDAGCLTPALRGAAAGFAWLAMAAVWVGAILAIAVLLRRRNSGTQPSPSGQERETAFTGLAIFLLSAGMFVALRHPHHPHYYNGAWSGALILLLLALGTGWRWRIVRAAYALYLVCMASLLLDVQTALHRRGGDATLRYGPTLGNQCEVAADAVKQVRGGLRQVLLTGTYAFFPHAFEILFRLDPAWGGRPLVHTLSTPAEGVRCLRVADGPNGLPAGDASRQALIGLQTGARVRLVIVPWPPPGQPAMGR